MTTSSLARFLVFGGLAAAINWLARIALSFFLPFEAAIGVAYAIGMTAGYLLYKRYVWRVKEPTSLERIAAFLAVNAVGAVVVLLVSIALRAVLGALGVPDAIAQALAHGTGIAAGAVANYVGHGLVTFRRAGPARRA